MRESCAFLECGVRKSEDFGDHVFVVARVEHAEASEDFGDYWEFVSYEPISYAGLGRPIGAFSAQGDSKDLERGR